VELTANALSDAETALQLGGSTKTIQQRKKRPEVRAALAAQAGVDAVRMLRDRLPRQRPLHRASQPLARKKGREALSGWGGESSCC